MSTVYVLGSGFSVAAGAPLSRQVLTRMFSPENLTPELAELEQWLARHLFQHRPNWQEEANIEEVVTRLDLYRYYQALSDKETKELINREELLLMVFTQLLQPDCVNRNLELYRYFVNLLRPGITVITFNYDLILEAALSRAGALYFYPHLGDVNEDIISKGIKILKLHGSLNFYFCPKCGYVHDFTSRFTQRPSLLKAQGITLRCIKCEESEDAQLKHLMVAPTLFKSYSIPLLRQWWFEAFQALSGASEVYFIGYSIPRSDLLSAQLFDFSARLVPSPPGVWVINGPRSNGVQHGIIFKDSEVYNTRLHFEEWVTSFNPD